jgi:hypothetical protein
VPEVLLAVLTREELIAITGYKQKGAQARWLRAHRIKFLLNAFGHPVVGRLYFDQFAGSVGRRPGPGPNWDAQFARSPAKR